MNAPAPSLPQAVRQARERMAALLAGHDREAAAWIEQLRDARPPTPTVVVVGETNRGKSSLVNALLATPNLSPVDAGTATATYVVIRHGERWEAAACHPALADPVPIELAQLPEWISQRCSALHDSDPPEGHLPPRYVEVFAPVPLLERLTLVDTPGVGGLQAVHGELAAQAAASATALLFVVDAGAPFTRGELGFLQRLAGHVETVVFALTKIDQHRGWREILQANRALLAEHAPRFAGAQFHPVSARLFESAATAPNPEVATLLRERSGIAELQIALQRQVAGRAAMLGEANLLRAVSTALAGLATRLTADERALTTAEYGEAGADTLRERRDALTAERRSSGRSWQLRLRGEIQRARVESLHEVAGEVRSAQTWFRRAIDEADRQGLAQLPYQVDASLQLISARTAAGLGRRLSRVAEAALAELFTADELAAVHAEFARRSAAGRPPIVLRPPDRRPGGAEDKLLVAMGVSGGLGAGRLVALPLAGLGAAAGLIVLPASIVLGLGAGWWMARVRRHAADRQHLKQWLADVLADARSALDQVVAEQMIDAEQQLSIALDEALGRRVAAIEDELREVDRALRMDAAERGRRLQAIRTVLAETTAGRRQVELLLARIRELST
ncbi:MAG TPA: dynamin family protein [Pseudonocardiaceae bacterium]|nr:dynamin family protein [Pseudonocardiaceae bacterium]